MTFLLNDTLSFYRWSNNTGYRQLLLHTRSLHYYNTNTVLVKYVTHNSFWTLTDSTIAFINSSFFRGYETCGTFFTEGSCILSFIEAFFTLLTFSIDVFISRTALHCSKKNLNNLHNAAYILSYTVITIMNI